TQIQSKLKTKKTSYNAFGKYYFRKAEDILEALKPFLIEHGVTVRITEEIISNDPVPIIQSTATISDGDNAIHGTAIVGVDLNQKGMQTAQQFGAASSYGKKYALGNLFLLDDTQDSDATNNHGKETSAKQWLTRGNAQWHKAVDYVKAGGSVDAIKQKYSMSKDVEVELKKFVNE
ncbi:MAG: ERF family protein, partial [Colwellia sp.]|nr:ERF family protein [Colwellia sp.]